MCTAISYQGTRHFFGRNLDLNISYCEEVTVTPRQFPLTFRQLSALPRHLAMVGMATVSDGYPLYYEATNEAGLSMAGLNFPGNAVYFPIAQGKDNVAPFELIPWILGQCKTVAEARGYLERLNIADIPFSAQFPASPLHWILADREQAITVESAKDGLHIYANPYGVLTNNPPFPYHTENIGQYLHLTSAAPENRFGPGLQLCPSSMGVGAMGLPGDWSSPSRFVRAAFTKWNAQAVSGAADLAQCFHILGSVAFPAGSVMAETGLERTIYSCICDTNDGIYYYTTYSNHQITAVDMHRENLEGSALARYPMRQVQQVRFEN